MGYGFIEYYGGHFPLIFLRGESPGYRNSINKLWIWFAVLPQKSMFLPGTIFSANNVKVIYEKRWCMYKPVAGYRA